MELSDVEHMALALAKVNSHPEPEAYAKDVVAAFSSQSLNQPIPDPAPADPPPAA